MNLKAVGLLLPLFLSCCGDSGSSKPTRYSNDSRCFRELSEVGEREVVEACCRHVTLFMSGNMEFAIDDEEKTCGKIREAYLALKVKKYKEQEMQDRKIIETYSKKLQSK